MPEGWLGLIESFGDALRHHSFCGSGIDRLDLIGEGGSKPRQPGAVGPVRRFPQSRPDQRLAAMKEDLVRRYLKDGPSGLALHGEACAQLGVNK